MIAWANESDDFYFIQLQIATSLWMMSLSNWKKQPSLNKQRAL